MQIRPAHVTDAAALNELLHQLGYPQDGTATTEGRIQAWGDEPSSAVYVADSGGDLLGLVAVHLCPFFERAGSWGRIVALVVADQARGQGVGGRLVTAAETFAASRGCVRMEVTSAARRRDAHAFYRRRGFVDQTGRAARFLRELDPADGAFPSGTTVFDEVPAVVNLGPALLAALRKAAVDAAADGVEFQVNSGWRSPEYQDRLRREAVSRYGSEEEAARWVATPDTSPHVSGDAVDIGRGAGQAWLSEYGAAYGLCQIYRNEPWHFELRPEAVEHGCPPMYDDPTHDPRMRR